MSADQRPGQVVLLSDRVGRPVLSTTGARLGRVEDLTVRLDRPHPVVHRVLVRGPRGVRYLPTWSGLVDAADVVRITEGERLRPEARPRALPLEADELLLARDVMDTQVVDLDGLRLARVADVLLVRDGAGRLEVAAVDIGVGALLRRMGLRRLGGRLRPVAVDWQDLHLTSGRGHEAQLSTATAGFHRLDGRGLAELLARLSPAHATDVIRTVGPERAAVAVRHSHPAVGSRLAHALGPGPAPPRPRRFLRTSGWRVHRPPDPRPPQTPDGRGG